MNNRFERMLAFFFCIIIITIPLTRFLWDAWSQYLFFLITVAVITWVVVQDLVVRRVFVIPGLHYSFGAFALLFALSAYLSPFKDLSRAQTVSLFSSFTLFFIAQRLHADSKRILAKTLCISASLFSLFYILTLSAGHLPDPAQALEFFINPNLVASYMLLSLFVALSFYKDSKAVSLICLALASASLILVKSTAAFMGALLAIGYIIKLTGQPRWMTRKIIAGGCILLLLGISLTIFTGWMGQSLTDRMRWWSTSLQMILSHPFFGSGPGTFEKLAPGHFGPGQTTIFAHNYPLQIISDIGIPAALCLAFFLFTVFRRASNPYLKGGIIALFFQNLFDFSMHFWGIFFLFLITLELAASDENEKLVPCSKSTGLVVTIIALTAFFFSGYTRGVRPLLAIESSLYAKEAFDKMDLEAAEKLSRRSIEWDDLPAQHYSDLSRVLAKRYLTEKGDHSKIEEALAMQKEALKRDPSSKYYRKQMNKLLELAGKNSAPLQSD